MFFKKVGLWKRLLAASVVYFCAVQGFTESKYFSWDFSDCDLKDILYAVSIDTGISIVADDTVAGRGDLKFAGNSFEVAFDTFLKASRLYVEKEENVWTVSRYSVFQDSDGRLSFDAYDMSPALMLEKLSLYTDMVITYDALPAAIMTVHFKDLSEFELITSLSRRFGSYEVIRNSNGVHIGKTVGTLGVDAVDGYVCFVMNEDGSIDVDLKDALFSDVVNQFFERVCNVTGEKTNYSFLSNSEARIQRAVFKGYSVNEVFQRLCSLGGFDAYFSDNCYFILRDDKAKEELITGKRNWSKFFLKYTSTELIFSLIHSRVGNIECIEVSDRNFFFAKVSDTERFLIEELICEVDEKSSTYLVELKYLKPGEFLQQLPPSVSKDKVFVSDDNSCVYFKGSEEEYLNLCEQLESFDKPAKRISYDLLILQYDQTCQNLWNVNASADTLSLGDRNSISAQIGSVLNLNVNVVRVFGLKLAASLQTSIEESATKVFADTTLHGVSGKQICFQNTNTYRYRDNNLDPDTGKPVYSGITKEIVSGITLDILGWASGDGMITSSVKATVSRQGIDTSSSTGNPPPTSEKVVTTEVCCKSGEPVILSGLVQDSITLEQKRIPVISKLPLIGLLFKSKEKTKEQTQTVIYLIPHVEGVLASEKNEISLDNSINRIENLISGVVYEEL